MCLLIYLNSTDLEAFTRKIFPFCSSIFSSSKQSFRNSFLSYTITFRALTFPIYFGYKNGFSLCIYTVSPWACAFVFGTMCSCMELVIYSRQLLPSLNLLKVICSNWTFLASMTTSNLLRPKNLAVIRSYFRLLK